VGDFDDIKSRPITRESVAGHERTFGPSSDEVRTPKRTRYVYRNGRCVEQGGPEDTGPEEREDDLARNHIVSDLYMVGTTTLDDNGKPVDLGSRAKRRAYMKENGLSDMSDWRNYWADAEKRRAAVRDGTADRTARREAIGRAMYEAAKRGR
jgi:hypothetical protein